MVQVPVSTRVSSSPAALLESTQESQAVIDELDAGPTAVEEVNPCVLVSVPIGEAPHVVPHGDELGTGPVVIEEADSRILFDVPLEAPHVMSPEGDLDTGHNDTTVEESDSHMAVVDTTVDAGMCMDNPLNDVHEPEPHEHSSLPRDMHGSCGHPSLPSGNSLSAINVHPMITRQLFAQCVLFKA
ncbi:hypothetical protein V6N11_038835 [Hibiscus sabdariffa]|uniref:Uncharacterized protein n=1 Tax=Hibiscus sabdariffa TaxID=183260 RepID=A0ABR2SL52_9ROSI